MKKAKAASHVIFYFLIICIFIASAYLGSETTSVVAGLIPVKREHTIIIDGGHGGVDGGATSCTGVLESQINLEIALRLNDLFRLLGYETKMIRTTDCSIHTEGETIAAKKVSDLKARVQIVNETENAVLLSIHQNTFSDSRYSGAQVFYSAEGESRELAEVMQATLIDTLNLGSNRTCKKADGIYLMDRINCTGILVECGFLSNPSEEAKLRSEEYQKKLCVVMASTLTNFLDR